MLQFFALESCSLGRALQQKEGEQSQAEVRDLGNEGGLSDTIFFQISLNNTFCCTWHILGYIVHLAEGLDDSNNVTISSSWLVVDDVGSTNNTSCTNASLAIFIANNDVCKILISSMVDASTTAQVHLDVAVMRWQCHLPYLMPPPLGRILSVRGSIVISRPGWRISR